MLTSCQRIFLADEWDRLKAQKRGGGQRWIPFEGGTAETRCPIEPVDARSPDKLFEHRWAVTRFEREARALAKLSHPNVVAMYEFGQVESQPCFIMEDVDGLNVRQLERSRKLAPREVLQIIPQIAPRLPC